MYAIAYLFLTYYMEAAQSATIKLIDNTTPSDRVKNVKLGVIKIIWLSIQQIDNLH